jgi:large subunit ribosomal protein L32|tara:strand:+ start:62570 stop:62761 length:192 start_codon:yes stop_codon:yes gene_type:complete
MAHPKRKISKTRRDKRRTHINAEMPTIAIDSTTGQPHLFHRAHWFEGKLYYKGKVVMEKETMA